MPLLFLGSLTRLYLQWSGPEASNLTWHFENLLLATPKFEALRLVDMRTNDTASTQYSLSRVVQSLQDRSIQLLIFHVHPTAFHKGVLDLEFSDVMY
ncbi:hypothetical protein BGZ47_007548 [Haplosporangium gracile]|nr:hypothetical protein BGZ47_007548 [Haplosporangium gracile]